MSRVCWGKAEVHAFAVVVIAPVLLLVGLSVSFDLLHLMNFGESMLYLGLVFVGLALPLIGQLLIVRLSGCRLLGRSLFPYRGGREAA